MKKCWKAKSKIIISYDTAFEENKSGEKMRSCIEKLYTTQDNICINEDIWSFNREYIMCDKEFIQNIINHIYNNWNLKRIDMFMR